MGKDPAAWFMGLRGGLPSTGRPVCVPYADAVGVGWMDCAVRTASGGASAAPTNIIIQRMMKFVGDAHPGVPSRLGGVGILLQ